LKRAPPDAETSNGALRNPRTSEDHDASSSYTGCQAGTTAPRQQQFVSPEEDQREDRADDEDRDRQIAGGL
jgi:hypothetical protein